MVKEWRTKWKRGLALLAGVLVLAGTMSGCGQRGASGGIGNGSNGSDDMAVKGAYLEKEVSLSGIPEGVIVKQLYTVEDQVHLLTVDEEEEGLKLQEWALQEGNLVEVTKPWLADFMIPAESYMDIQLFQDGNGIQYLYYQTIDSEIETYRGNLWRGDGTEAKDITPEKWSVVNEDYGIYEFINGITALKNGTLVVQSSLSADRINGEDGSVLDSVPLTAYYGDGDRMVTDGENVYLFSANMSGTIEGVEKWAGGSLKDAVTLPFGQNSSYNVKLCALPDGTLISADTEGIFRCEAGTEDWKKLISGLETSFSLSGIWCTGLAALQDGRIYALFNQEGGTSKLMVYEYDPEAVPVVSTVLKLYAVEESSLLQNAAAMYHREHPDILIEVQYAYSAEDKYSRDGLDYNTVQQQINTMLMGSEAPDILVLDHLNKESYMEKGLLVDLQDIIAPMEANGEVLSNITGAYRNEEGKQYIVPMQFGFSFALGRDISVQDMSSMQTLAAFLGSKSESYMGPRTVAELVDLFYPYFCEDMVENKELNREVLTQYLESLKQIAENSGIIEKRDKNERGYNMWELAYRAKFALEASDGFNGSMFPLSMADYIKGDFTAFENVFIPHVEMGVSAKSEYQDIAKDFIAFCLSEEVQGRDYYIGFPINAGCLETLAKFDRSEYSACTSIEIGEGAEEMFNIDAYPEETAQKLVALCKGLDRPYKEDAKIREVLIDTLPLYLQGAQSLEETMEKIEGGLKMYLAE